MGEPPAWGELASRRGGSRPAPSRAQEGGREHPRRGRRPPHRPAVERARKLLSATRWTNFFWSSGASLSPHTPAGTAERGEWGKPVTVVGWGGNRQRREAAPPIRPSSPLPHPVRGLLGNCDLNGCYGAGEVLPVAGPLPGRRCVFCTGPGSRRGCDPLSGPG